jgi:hypothetical protein
MLPKIEILLKSCNSLVQIQWRGTMLKLSFWDIMASMVMLAGMALATIFINIFINPYSFLNPFPPPTPIATLNIPTMTPSQKALPELWTLTPTLFGATDSPGTPTDTATNSTATASIAAGTITGTAKVLSSSTATPTKSITPTITKTLTRTPNKTLTSYYVKTAVKTATKTAVNTATKTAVNTSVNTATMTATKSPTSSDTTAPTNPGTPSTTSATGDSTPNWTWTASTDSGSGLSLYQITWGNNNACNNTVYSSTTNSWAAPAMPANTTLYICVRAKDNAGNISGWVGPTGFTYSAAGSPSVSTNAASSITNTSALLNGQINANGNDTTVYFEYGPTTTYGTVFAGNPSVVTGTAAASVTYSLAGLTPNTTYHYRAYGSNAIARVNGADSSFTTRKSSSTTAISVIAPEPSIVDQPYDVPVTVTGSGGTPTGTVSVSDGSGAGCTITLANGSGSCNLTSTTPGSPKTITAAYSGNNTFLDSSITATHVVNNATTVVSTWPTTGAITYGQTLASVTLTGGVASVPGTFAFIAPATAPVTGTALQGIRFTPTNSVGYNAVDGTVNVTVNKATPGITFNVVPSPSYVYDATFEVKAVTTNTEYPLLNYSYNSGNACKHKGYGVDPVFIIESVGTCTVQADVIASDNYNAATQTQDITISKGTPEIIFDEAPTPTYGDATFTVSARTNNINDSSLTYSVVGGTACTYSGSDGVFNIVSAGSCVVQAIGESTDYYNAGTATQTITIAKATPVITFVEPAPAPVYLTDANFTVSASTTNTDDLNLTYSVVSGNCALDSGSTFTISGARNCVVQASGAATTNFNAATAIQTVTIDKATPIITFDPAPSPTYSSYGHFSVHATTTNTERPYIEYFVKDNPLNGPCSYYGSGEFVMHYPGTCIIGAQTYFSANFYSAFQTLEVIIS